MNIIGLNIKKIHLLLIVFNSVLLLMDNQSIAVVSILVLSSFILCYEPITLLPLLLLSSISTHITVIPGLAANFYYEYLMLVASIFRCSKQNINKYALYVLLLSIYIYIVSLFSLSGNTELAIKLIVFTLPIPFFTMFRYDVNKLSVYMCAMALAVAVYISLKITFAPVLYIHTEWHEMLDKSDLQLSFSQNVNPNTAAQLCLIAALIISTFAMKYKKHKLLFFLLLSMVPIAIIGSRTVFFSLLIILSIIFLFLSDYSKTHKFKLMSIIVIGCFVFGLESVVNDRVDINSIIEDGGSGRFNTWEYLFVNVIPKNLFLGIGYGRINYTKIGLLFDADNMYVDILTQLGVLGAGLFIIMYIKLFKKVTTNEPENRMLLVSMLLFPLFIGIGETVFDTFIFWVMLMCIYVEISSAKKRI